jgi:hypothetical protein
MSYILRRLVPSCTLLCIYRAAEQTEQQSNRATEQTAAEQPAGHMTCALLSRDSQLLADCTACTFGTVACLGVITIAHSQ